MTVAREKWNFVAYLFDVKFENIIIFLSQSSGFGLSMLRLSHDQESTTGFSFISSPFFAQISFDYIQNMSSISCFQTRISRRTYKVVALTDRYFKSLVLLPL